MSLDNSPLANVLVYLEVSERGENPHTNPRITAERERAFLNNRVPGNLTHRSADEIHNPAYDGPLLGYPESPGQSRFLRTNAHQRFKARLHRFMLKCLEAVDRGMEDQMSDWVSVVIEDTFSVHYPTDITGEKIEASGVTVNAFRVEISRLVCDEFLTPFNKRGDFLYSLESIDFDNGMKFKFRLEAKPPVKDDEEIPF
jgi:hypothetical protein